MAKQAAGDQPIRAVAKLIQGGLAPKCVPPKRSTKHVRAMARARESGAAHSPGGAVLVTWMVFLADLQAQGAELTTGKSLFEFLALPAGDACPDGHVTVVCAAFLE